MKSTLRLTHKLSSLFLIAIFVTACAHDVRVTPRTDSQATYYGTLEPFASEATYLSESASNDFATVGPEGTVVLDLGQHPAGTYAISVYYDINDNGKLDTGLFRIPKEKIGFSNNARGRFGPAKWKDTQFDVTEDIEVNIVISKAIKK